MDWNRLCWLVLMSALLSLGGSALCQKSGPQGKPMDYSGEWWLSRSSIEQRGYINGDADCYTSELKGDLKSMPPAEKVQTFVSEFYEGPTRWSVPASRVIRMFGSHPTASHQASSSGGESWNEPHGYWDGLWWKGGTIPRLEQLGYVQGYLACYREEAHSPDGTFSKVPSEYVSLINEWYRSTGKEGAKIADVLFKFRDQAQRSKPGSTHHEYPE